MEFLHLEEMFKVLNKSIKIKQELQKHDTKKISVTVNCQKVEEKVNYKILDGNLIEAIKFKQDFKSSFDQQYNPEQVEKCWNEWWKEQKFYHVPKEELQKTSQEWKFIMVLPPPNVTGKLHIGHALMSAIEDCMVRYKRMKGFQCVFIPGLDHAGIATQSVVEKMLAKQNLFWQDMTREEFLSHIWRWKEEYGNEILNQFNRLGCSFDYQRQFFTMDQQRSEAVIITFCQLYEKGLIYRANWLVNWSCKLSTAISNIEVDTIEVKPFEKLKIPGYDKEVEFGVLVEFSYKVKDSDEEIIVATTWIETMLGDVAVAVHSTDSRYAHLIGKDLVHPFIQNWQIKIIADDILVDKEFGTGAVKITPAHDPNDFKCGLRNNLQFINIINDNGTLNENAGQYKGMKRYEARERIIQDLKELNQLKGKKKNAMSLQICSKSGDVIEPLIKPQWYVKCGDISKKLIEIVENKEINIIPSNHIKVWNNFMNNSEDWCISWQLYWGHRIPAYRVKIEDGTYLKSNQQEVWFVGKDIDVIQKQVKEIYKGSFELIQDEDVLDTWFSSALLPFSCAGWPNENDPEYKLLFPNTILETGYDILFFWVAKMAMMSLMLTGQVPFKTVLLHNIVRAENGEKMSKSKGNVIDPIEIIDGCSLASIIEKIEGSVLSEKEKKISIQDRQKKYPQGFPRCGADALRFSLLSYVKENKDINLDIQIPIRDRMFCNKVWNSYKFIRGLLSEEFEPITLQSLKLREADKWILKNYQELLNKVNTEFDQY